jgi:hypothetical protein
MQSAVEAVRNEEMGFLTASKIYEVPRSTLENYVNHKTKHIADILKVSLGRKSVISQDSEDPLVRYSLLMEEMFYSLRTSDVRQFAFLLALKNTLEHPLPVDKGLTGRKVLRNILIFHCRVQNPCLWEE